MKRHDKRMLLTMGAVIAAVGLISGLTSLPHQARASHDDADWVVQCYYEAGNGGDLMATIKNDQGSDGTGTTSDGFVDQGGCIINFQDTDACTTAVMRDGGLGIGLGELTLGSMALAMELPEDDAQSVNATTQCDLRDAPSRLFNKKVEVGVSMLDDVYEWQVSGVLCTDEDGDNIACETGEIEEVHSGCIEPRTTIDTSSVDHLVLFLNGPVNSRDNACSSENPVGATTGWLSPSYGVNFHFYIV